MDEKYLRLISKIYNLRLFASIVYYLIKLIFDIIESMQV